MPHISSTTNARKLATLRRWERAISERLRLAILSSTLHPDAPGALKIPLAGDALTAARARASREVAALADGAERVAHRQIAAHLQAGRPVVRTRRAAKSAGGSAGGGPNPSVPSKLTATLLLDEIKCVKRTRRFGEFEMGFDELWVIGLLVDADTGAVRKIKADRGSWKDGMRRTYHPPQTLGTMELSATGLPNRCEALLFLCDNDPGVGISEFLEALYEHAVEVVEEVSEDTENEEEEEADEEAPPADESIWEILLQLLLMVVVWFIGFARRDDILWADPIETRSPSWTSEGQIGWQIGARHTHKVTQYKADYRIQLHWTVQAS